jgi:hypothetical protein
MAHIRSLLSGIHIWFRIRLQDAHLGRIHRAPDRLRAVADGVWMLFSDAMIASDPAAPGAYDVSSLAASSLRTAAGYALPISTISLTLTSFLEAISIIFNSCSA